MAWLYILEATPMMANPHEYREALWAVLHDGTPPPKKAAEPGKPGAPRALSRARTGMTVGDKKELANFMEQIEQLKQTRAS